MDDDLIERIAKKPHADTLYYSAPLLYYETVVPPFIMSRIFAVTSIGLLIAFIVALGIGVWNGLISHR